MRDEMARAKDRLELKFPGTNEPVRPYYLEYRLLDLEVREVVGQFGALMSSTRTRNRFMNVQARVGSFKQDSSNFVSDEGFRGFIGSTGSVGIDRDYDSLRQDLWIATDHLLTSEGTEIRTNRSFAAVEAGLATLAKDGMQLNHFYASYAPNPADLASVDTVKKGLNVTGSELMALRASPPAQDYTGPVLFESRAAAPLVAQVLGPALNGARPPVAFQPVMEQFLSNVGGKSDWVSRIGARVLPTTVTVVDDPSAKDFQGHALIGGYRVDDEGVPAQKVTAVEGGALKELLMSRRPGPDSDKSNGHGRSAFLNDAKPTPSNLFFTPSEALPAADLKKKFLDICRSNKQEYCLEVKEMDNSAISLLH